MILATGCRIQNCQLGDRESYSAIYDSNEYEAVYDGGITAVPDAKGEGGSDDYPGLANVEGCRDGSEWFQCLCWRLHRKEFAKCFRTYPGHPIDASARPTLDEDKSLGRSKVLYSIF